MTLRLLCKRYVRVHALKNLHSIPCQRFSVKSKQDRVHYWEEKLTAFKKAKGSAKDFYNEWAAEYQDSICNMGWDPPEKCIEYFLKNNTNKNTPKILDICCGSGLVGQSLQKQCTYDYELYGCDIAPNMIKETKKLNIYTAVEEMDFNSFPYNIYATDSFDTVICSGALSYCEDMKSFLDECIRITRYKGLIVISHREDLMKQHSNLFEDLINEKKIIQVDNATNLDYIPNSQYYKDENILYQVYVAMNNMS
eukprot:UN01639